MDGWFLFSLCALSLFSTVSWRFPYHLVFPQLWTSDNQGDGEDADEAKE